MALIAALRSIHISDLHINTIFIANADLHNAIITGNPQHSWRLDPLISSIIDYLSDLGNPQFYIIPKTWMNVAASLALHGANSHVLTLFHHGKDLSR